MAVNIDPGYSYSNAYSNQRASLYMGIGDASQLVTGSLTLTNVNSGILLSGSAAGTITLLDGSTINLATLSTGVQYTLALSAVSASAGGVYVIY
jgi:hypothetical protein